MLRELPDGQAVFAYPPQTVRANEAMITPADVRIAAVHRPRSPERRVIALPLPKA